MYKDLREFIELVDKLGVLRRIEGADPRFEIGAVTEVAAGRSGAPALLFDAIKGFPRGFRIFTNATTSPQRAALALGIDPTLRPLDALKAWMEKRKTLQPRAPVAIKDAAFLQHAIKGKELDLARFPAPVWHRRDGGPFLGSGSIVIMRDPNGGWINASIYRVQVHGRDKVTLQFDHAGRHGAIIAKKYWDAGKPCPLAVVNGEDPALFVAGFEYLPAGQSEYDFAGAIKGAPIEVFSAPLTGLPIPAHAEIVLEGDLLPMSESALPEGPFGEFTGYYASDARPAPGMGQEGHRGLSSRRPDPAGIAADEAAALSFRPSAARRHNLAEPRERRRDRRGWRLAARLAAHDRGGAQAALRWPCQARRARRRRA